MSELKPTTEESIRHFETQQKRYVREHNGKLCPHYANAIEALRRAQPAEPLTDHISDVTKMIEPCGWCSYFAEEIQSFYVSECGDDKQHYKFCPMCGCKLPQPPEKGETNGNNAR